MSQQTTKILLSQVAYNNPGNGAPYTVVGNSSPAAAYYLGNRDLQTVNIGLTSCTGNIVLEATLAANPVDTDWFKVYELEANANAVANSASKLASDAKMYTNVEGNFVYIRAKIVNFQSGIVDYIKVSY